MTSAIYLRKKKCKFPYKEIMQLLMVYTLLQTIPKRTWYCEYCTLSITIHLSPLILFPNCSGNGVMP